MKNPPPLFSSPQHLYSLQPPISLSDFMLALSRKTLSLHRSTGGSPDKPKIGGEDSAGVWDCLYRSTRALVGRICLTRVIESALNYYSNWRACLTVELPVKRVGQKPEPVKRCQSMETRSVGLMDFSMLLHLCAQRAPGQGRRGKIKIIALSCGSVRAIKRPGGLELSWARVSAGSEPEVLL